MAMLDELDSEDLQILQDALIRRLAAYTRLEKTTEERVDVMLIGRLLRQIDREMDKADEEKRAGIAWANLDLFERRKAGNQ